jgi:hypothetical protein
LILKRNLLKIDDTGICGWSKTLFHAEERTNGFFGACAGDAIENERAVAIARSHLSTEGSRAAEDWHFLSPPRVTHLSAFYFFWPFCAC